jgi:hypothetical protein
LYQIIVEKDSLRVLDSSRERFSVKAANDTLRPGYYRIPFIERFAPRTRHYGAGRMFIDALSPKDVDGLVVAEKAERRFDVAMKLERLPVLSIGRPPEECSIHGGGETLSMSAAVSNYQPLIPSPCGIRIQNFDFDRIAEFLQSRLRIQQLIVLTVMP